MRSNGIALTFTTRIVRQLVEISSAISVIHVILRERAPKRSFGRRPKELS
jgi:hypothetical protein